MYKTGMFSKLCNTTIKTLYFYEKSDLLKPDYIDTFTDYRYYSIEKFSVFNKIRFLKRIGFSLDEIKIALSSISDDVILQILEKKEQELKSKLAVTQQQIMKLNQMKNLFLEGKDMYNVISGETVKIKIVGIGDIGNKIINNLVDSNSKNIEVIPINTNHQYEFESKIINRIQIDDKNDLDKADTYKKIKGEIKSKIIGAQILFIVFNLDDKTTTSIISLLSETIKSLGMLTVGLFTETSTSDDNKLISQMINSNLTLKNCFNSFIVLPNVNDSEKTIQKVCLFFRSLADLITDSGIVNIEFSDVTTLLKSVGYSYIGFSEAIGINKIELAAQAVIYSLQSQISLTNVKSIILNILISSNVTLEEVNIIVNSISNDIPNTTLIWGVVIDNNLKDEVKVTLLATI